MDSARDDKWHGEIEVVRLLGGASARRRKGVSVMRHQWRKERKGKEGVGKVQREGNEGRK